MLRRMLPRIAWFVAALGIAWGTNRWRQEAAMRALEAARRGDRGAAEAWVERALRRSQCELQEAREYLSSNASRQRLYRSDYVDTFVGRLYADGAPKIEVCDSEARFARYLLVTLPDDQDKQERLIADSQSLVRRDALVYQGVSSAEVEEVVRRSTLVGKHRVLVDLPAEAD
jgi:hypothetical protein